MSVAYNGPKSRTERPRNTKIGTEVAHVTCDSDTTFKVKRSEVKVTRRFNQRGINASGSLSGERGNVLAVGTYCYVAVCTLQARRVATSSNEKSGTLGVWRLSPQLGPG